jgi:hypothetical protein
MKLSADCELPFPRALVFETYRDHILDLLPYLPNVRGIDPKSSTGEGGVVEKVNVWHGGGEIPAVARAVISESMLSWTDRARWDAEAFVCDWHIQTHAFTDAVTCEGRHAFVEREGGKAALLQTTRVLTIDATKVRGVPRLFASNVGRLVEEFLAAKIRPNLVEVSKGLGQYLARV